MRRSFAGLTVVVLLAACGKKADPTAYAIQTAPVQRQSIVVDVEATGVIQPINAVEIRSKASGEIIKMPVETGSQVKTGDLLAQIDPRDVKSRYDQAVAALHAAQVNLQIATAQKARQDTLFQQGVITAPEHETAEQGYAQAQSQVVKAEGDLQIAQVDLEGATVTAPMSGTIIERDVAQGAVITSSTSSFGGGTILMKMANLGKVLDSTLVNEVDIGHVRPGQTATVTVDAYPNRTFTGVVQKIAPQAVVDQSVTMFPVLIALDNGDGALMPGMNSDVSVLVTRKDNVLVVPNDAVRSPRDAMAAASALGLDPNQVRQVLGSQFAGRRGRGGRRGAARAGSAAGDIATGVAIPEGSAQGQRGRGGRNGARRGANGGRGMGAANADGGTGRAANGGDDPDSLAGPERSPSGVMKPHAGLVFVAQNGSFVPKMVMLGAGNYDVTQVLSGLKQGDQVALISAAMLQQERDRQMQRIRSRAGLPGMRQSNKKDSSDTAGRSRGRRGP
ncbi:MAG TPA: efflux RND transporter periplasmic adaptor subunit [Gemmatimonadaceae bacterium]|nr:efflux RND transporter periplasmic adaptor subunit [Gemmatimonadaceae bacterium]